MKKYLLFTIILWAISTTIIAQESKFDIRESNNFSTDAVLTALTTAPDFTVTFTDGSTANLYNTCDSGNTVMLDFFYVDWTYCQANAAKIDSAYVAHGSGTGNIKFWGIDYGDNKMDVIAYKSQYGVTNPCASGTQGGGNAVINVYWIVLWPGHDPLKGSLCLIFFCL